MIDRQENILKIDDMQLLRQFSVVGFLGAVAMLIAFMAYFFLSQSDRFSMILIIVFASVLAVIIASVMILQMPYRRISVFDKKEGTYKLIEYVPFNNLKIEGKLDEIKSVKIAVTKYTSSEPPYSDTYKYQTFLVLDSILSYDNSIIALEEENTNHFTAKLKANAAADFLRIPIKDESEEIVR